MYDWILREGRVVDGTGRPSFQADLAIRDSRIAAIGDLRGAAARREIAARGAVVCPGFVDPHSHSDLYLLRDPFNEPKLRQGVTTEVLGQDGLSHVPAAERTQATVEDLWRGINGPRPGGEAAQSVAAYLRRLDRRVAVNTAFLVPHLTVRIEVMGLATRAARESEIEQMQAIVARAMAEGALGLSTGLTYWPANFATTQELVALCRVVAAHGGLYATHLRDYLHEIVAALEESAEIGRRAGLPVHVSHLNHRAGVVLPVIEAARQSGLDLTYDIYPYLAGNTLLTQFLPAWVLDGSIADILARLRNPGVQARLAAQLRAAEVPWEAYRLCHVPNGWGEKLEGLDLPSAAARQGVDLARLVCDLLVSTRLAVTVVAAHTHRQESDLVGLMRHPAQMFCSDAILVGGHPHPRTYGTYPRVLGRYVRERQVLDLEQAIQKMTSLPARRFGLRGRGELQEGYAADIVLLEPERVADRADFDRPRRWPVGIQAVWVNGELVLGSEGLTGATPGRALGLVSPEP